MLPSAASQLQASEARTVLLLLLTHIPHVYCMCTACVLHVYCSCTALTSLRYLNAMQSPGLLLKPVLSPGRLSHSFIARASMTHACKGGAVGGGGIEKGSHQST
jgi:hypothetical protein